MCHAEGHLDPLGHIRGKGITEGSGVGDSDRRPCRVAGIDVLDRVVRLSGARARREDLQHERARRRPSKELQRGLRQAKQICLDPHEAGDILFTTWPPHCIAAE